MLPKPASQEAMQSLEQWMIGEVAPEDLPQVDEEAAKVVPPSPRVDASCSCVDVCLLTYVCVSCALGLQI